MTEVRYCWEGTSDHTMGQGVERPEGKEDGRCRETMTNVLLCLSVESGGLLLSGPFDDLVPAGRHHQRDDIECLGRLRVLGKSDPALFLLFLAQLDLESLRTVDRVSE